MKMLSRAVVLFCLISCFGSAESLAQGGWFSQIDPPISDVYAVDHLDEQTAVAVDSLGRVLRSTSEDRRGPGFRWRIQYTGPTQLYGLFFASSDNGTAVGESGTILRSTDRGVTWSPQLSGTTANLSSVSFVNSLTGTAVGDSGTVLRTTDGGDTWTPQDAKTLAPLHGVSFLNANIGIAVGDSGTILRTTDGGDTWTTQDSGTTRHLEKVLFLDPNLAYAVGDFGTILRSTDEGATWTQQADVLSSHLAGISFANVNQGLAVGCRVSADGGCENSGIILRTEDGGYTWDAEAEYGSEILYAISFYNVNTAIAVGKAETFRVFVGGTLWLPGSIPRILLTGVSFLNASVGLAVGLTGPEAAIMRTTDGGVTWTVQRMERSLYGVTFVDANRAFAVGGTHTPDGVIVGTSDGGITWTRRYVQSGTTIVAVSFGDANTGIAVGINILPPYGGRIWRTTNGGDRWREVDGTFPELSAVSMGDANTGTATGRLGEVLRTTDGGATWATQRSGPGETFTGVSFVDANTGTIVGGFGGILRTTDGGATWTSQMPPTGELEFLGVSFVDANTGVVVGRSRRVPSPGVIFRTTDGGATWALQYSGMALPLLGVSMVDANTGTVVGGGYPDRGIILRTETGGK